MRDGAYNLIRQAVGYGGRIFVNSRDPYGAAIAWELQSQGLVVPVVDDMTGPDQGQWYELTAPAWELHWKRQRSTAQRDAHTTTSSGRQASAGC